MNKYYFEIKIVLMDNLDVLNDFPKVGSVHKILKDTKRIFNVRLSVCPGHVIISLRENTEIKVIKVEPTFGQGRFNIYWEARITIEGCVLDIQGQLNVSNAKAFWDSVSS